MSVYKTAVIPMTMSGFCAFANAESHQYCDRASCSCSCHTDQRSL